MKTLLSFLYGLVLLAGLAAMLAPHRAMAQGDSVGEQKSAYAALFAQCRASGGDPSGSVTDWNEGGCKCGGVRSGQITCPGSSSASDSSGGSSDLATQSATAMVKGMMNGNSQEFGLGVGGMILNGILEGSQDDGAAAAEEARREAAEKARQAALRRQAEEEQARQLALAKGRILGVLKDGTDAGDPFSTNTSREGAVAIVHEGPLTVGGLALKEDDVVQQASLQKPDSDPMVVDARNVPSGLPKPMDDAIAAACAGTPEGVCERVRKGFQAVMTRDWNVAKAWFQDAASRDPNNAWLNNLVVHSSATTAKPPAATGAPVTNADLDKVFDKIANDDQAARMKERADEDKAFDQVYNADQAQRMQENDALDRAFDLYYNAPPAAAAARQDDGTDVLMHKAFDLNYNPPAAAASR